MTSKQIIDKAKNCLIGREVLVSGCIMGVEASINNEGLNNFNIRIKWSADGAQYEKLIQKLQSSNLNVLLVDDK